MITFKLGILALGGVRGISRGRDICRKPPVMTTQEDEGGAGNRSRAVELGLGQVSRTYLE